MEICKPTGLKTDKYLEEYKDIFYLYDFGDTWQFMFTLENIVEDYYYHWIIEDKYRKNWKDH